MSSIIKKFIVTIQNGKLSFYQNERELFLQNLNNFEGKWAWLTITKFTKQRSLNQNKYYWGVLIKILSDSIGYTPDEMHEALKWHFLRVHDERPLETVRSTTELTTTEFEDYLESVRRWAVTDMNIDIPLPHEVEII